MEHQPSGPGRLAGRGHRACAAVVRTGLPALIVMAPAWFGAVEPRAITALSLGAVLVGMALLVLMVLEADRPRLSIGLPGCLGLAFLALIAFQLLPLPRSWIERISSGADRVYALNLPGYGGPADAIVALERKVLPDEAPPGRPTGKPLRTLSLDPHATRGAFLRAAFYLVMFLLVRNATPSPLPAPAVALALVIVGTLDAGYGLVEYLSRHQQIFGYVKKYYTDSVTGTYINRNHFAGLMELALPVGLGLALSLRRGGPRSSHRRSLREILLRYAQPQGAQGSLLILACAVMATGLLLSFSRAGILLGLLGLGLTTILARPASRPLRRALPLLVVLAAAAIPAYLAGTARIAERYGALAVDVEREGGRLPIWRQTLRLGSRFPLVGAGYGSFETVFPAYHPPRTAWYDHAHSDYLELFAETGWTGLALVLVGIGACLAGAWRGLRTALPRDRALLAGLTGGMAALLAHGLVDFNGQIPANVALLACVAGLCLSLSASDSARRAGRTALLALGALVLAVFGVLVLKNWDDGAKRAHDLRQIRTRLSEGSADAATGAREALARLGDAPKASHPDPEALALFSRYSLIGVRVLTDQPPHEEAPGVDAAGAREAIRAAYHAARRAMELQPTRAEHPFLAALALQTGELLGMLGTSRGYEGDADTEELVGRLLAQSSRLDPRNPSMRYTIGNLYLARDRVDEAVGEYAASLQAGDRFAEPIYAALWRKPDGPALVTRVSPTDPAGRLALARFHYHAGRYAEAEALYREMLPDDRLGPQGAEGLIRVLLRQGRSDEAEVICVDADGRFPAARRRVPFWKGQIAAWRGDRAAAVKHFEAALRSDPDSEEIHWALAKALCEQGQDKPCIARINYLLEEGSRGFHERSEKAARLLLARALERQGRIQDSLVQYLMVSSMDPDNRDVGAAVERLRRLL